MHVKDVKKEKLDALRANVAQSVKRQISLAPHSSMFNLLGLPKFNAPSLSIKGWTSPHQGKREIERRRRQIAKGMLTEANGLVRRS